MTEWCHNHETPLPLSSDPVRNGQCSVCWVEKVTSAFVIDWSRRWEPIIRRARKEPEVMRAMLQFEPTAREIEEARYFNRCAECDGTGENLAIYVDHCPACDGEGLTDRNDAAAGSANSTENTAATSTWWPLLVDYAVRDRNLDGWLGFAHRYNPPEDPDDFRRQRAARRAYLLRQAAWVRWQTVGERVVYDRELSADEQAQVAAYFRERYGL